MKALITEDYENLPRGSIIAITEEIIQPETNIPFYIALHDSCGGTYEVCIPTSICLEYDEETGYYDVISQSTKMLPEVTEQQKNIYKSMNGKTTKQKLDIAVKALEDISKGTGNATAESGWTVWHVSEQALQKIKD